MVKARSLSTFLPLLILMNSDLSSSMVSSSPLRKITTSQAEREPEDGSCGVLHDSNKSLTMIERVGLSELELGPDGKMSASLSEDLIFEILRLLPAKSLLSLRCVCKMWLKLIDSSDFISAHIVSMLTENC